MCIFIKIVFAVTQQSTNMKWDLRLSWQERFKSRSSGTWSWRQQGPLKHYYPTTTLHRFCSKYCSVFTSYINSVTGLGRRSWKAVWKFLDGSRCTFANWYWVWILILWHLGQVYFVFSNVNVYQQDDVSSVFLFWRQ